jgi:hypothetical protein
MEFITFYVLSIIGIFTLTFIITKIDERRQYNLIKMVSYANKYVKDFCYKNKTIKLTLVEDNVTPKYFDVSYNNLRTYTLFINDNPVVSLWEIDTLSKKIEMILNKSYDTKDLFKILKAYKKEYNKAWNEQYKIKYEKDKKSMY